LENDYFLEMEVSGVVRE